MCGRQAGALRGDLWVSAAEGEAEPQSSLVGLGGADAEGLGLGTRCLNSALNLSRPSFNLPLPSNTGQTIPSPAPPPQGAVSIGDPKMGAPTSSSCCDGPQGQEAGGC